MFVFFVLSLICLFGMSYCQTIPEQIHLSYPGNSAMTVTWVTQNATTNSVVLYQDQDGNYFNATGTATLFQDLGSEHRTFWIHRVTLENLAERTEYFYRCGDPSLEDGLSQKFSFVSLPLEPTELHFGIYGDFGLQNSVSLPRIINETQEGHFDMIFHIGDFAYDLDSDNARVGDQFMNMIQPIAAYVPYQTCPGNHEADHLALFGNYRNRFSMPGNDNMYFSFDLGNIHFVAFSTEHYFFFPEELVVWRQYEWLKADLQKANENRNQTPWIIAYAHRPLYCSDISLDMSTESDPEVYTDCTSDALRVRDGIDIFGERLYGIEKLFWEYGVDVYFCGHEHSYERMWPVYQGNVYNGSLEEPYTNPGAPVHIVTGSAGCPEGLDGFGGGLGPWSAFRSSTYGYGKFVVYNETHLFYEQVLDSNGTVLDSFTLIKENHGP